MPAAAVIPAPIAYIKVVAVCVDYVPALCIHCPSLLPIEWLSEISASASGSRRRHPVAEMLIKLGHLEEVKVVTRFP